MLVAHGDAFLSQQLGCGPTELGKIRMVKRKPDWHGAEMSPHSRLDLNCLFTSLGRLGRWQFAFVTLVATALPCRAVEVSGLLDLRLQANDSKSSWIGGGLDKSRFDSSGGGIRLGQAFLRFRGEPVESISATATFSAYDDRRGLLDINEAWLAWQPVPTSGWKHRVRAGSFFPATSLEIDYDSVGWTPRYTVSSSAVNSWIGEELRTNGLEYSLSQNGRMSGSSHSYSLTAALFAANDPAGTLLAWRGWTISDRIAGLRENQRLADLPVFQPGGPLPQQSRQINTFRELDSRIGHYLIVQYSYADQLELAAMRYDNNANPLVLRDGQYSWLTRFNHFSTRLKKVGSWDVSMQLMQGDTLMGPAAVYLDFNAWYLLATRPLGPGHVALRYDRFSTTERAADILPNDPNNEDGQSLALAYSWNLKNQLSLVTELLVVQSNRAARLQIGDPVQRTERSVNTSLRWQF